MEVIYADDNQKIMLKDRRFGSVKLLGMREWSILKNFAENTLEQITHSFQKEFIDKVISKGIEMNILVEQTTVANNITKKSAFGRIHTKIVEKDLGFIKLDLSGGFTLFKLFTVNLSPNNVFQRLNFKVVLGIWITFFLTFLSIVLINRTQYNFIFFDVTRRLSTPLPVLILSAFFTSFFFTILHELGHFIIYKTLGGKNNAIGVGSKFFVLPVFYVNTDTTYLWKSKWKRILVILGGTMADTLLILCISSFISFAYKDYPQLAFFSFMLIISLLIKVIFNLNFFITGNDGYFLFSEIFNQNNLTKTLQANKFHFFNQFKNGNIFHLELKIWLSIIYLCISFLFKALSIFMMIASVWYILNIS